MAAQSGSRGKTHEFRVAISGIELDEATVSRIAGAVQAAALAAMSEIDFKGDFAAKIGENGTQGIQIIALTSAQAEQLGLRER